MGLDYIMAKSTAERIADRLKDEHFLETFMLLMRLLDNGIMVRKRVARHAAGTVGAVYVPKEYIGRQVKCMIVPESPIILNMEEALMNNEQERVKLKKQYLKIKKEKEKLLSGEGPIEVSDEVKKELGCGIEEVIPLVNNPEKEVEDETDEEY